MALKTSYVVQPFEVHRKQLRPTRQEPALTEYGAKRKAVSAVSTRRTV